MSQSIEFLIGRLRALLSTLTSKLFMIDFEEYREFLSSSIKQLAVLCKTVRSYIEKSGVKDIDKLIGSLEKMEANLIDYSNIIDDKNIEAEEIYNISSDRITQIINYSNDFIQLFRKIEDYSFMVEEIHFLKNRLVELQRFEKNIFPLLKNIKTRLSESEEKISELTEQLDISEKKIFEMQAEVSRLSEERDSLQERIQEILGKESVESSLIFDKNMMAELKSENIALKQKIKELQDRVTQESENVKASKQNIENEKINELSQQLEETKKKYLERISQLVEERNVWRSRALQTSILNIDEALASLKNQFSEFEKQNRFLIEENESLRAELKKLKETTQSRY
ncbi:MAG: hypothetical protein QW327_01235 [Candidatus Odinarchaeota archaeon]